MESPAKFISQVRAEVGKIAWPTRREVITTTIMVLVMASLASVFFFLVDLGIKTGLARLLGFGGGYGVAIGVGGRYVRPTCL